MMGLLALGACSLQGCSPEGPPQQAPFASKNFMAPKTHGTCVAPPQNPLRWDVDHEKASELGCFNRHLKEFPGSWERTGLAAEIANLSTAVNSTIVFYDSVTSRPLFEVPKHRSWSDFQRESTVHGWPSFRDEEVVAENVRLLADGEMVSLSGIHLGFNDPDSKGNRYRINLACIAGKPLQ